MLLYKWLCLKSWFLLILKGLLIFLVFLRIFKLKMTQDSLRSLMKVFWLKEWLPYILHDIDLFKNAAHALTLTLFISKYFCLFCFFNIILLTKITIKQLSLIYAPVCHSVHKNNFIVHRKFFEVNFYFLMALVLSFIL